MCGMFYKILLVPHNIGMELNNVMIISSTPSLKIIAQISSR